MGLRPKYPPIIARFPPVKNFSYIPAKSEALVDNTYKQKIKKTNRVMLNRDDSDTCNGFRINRSN